MADQSLCWRGSRFNCLTYSRPCSLSCNGQRFLFLFAMADSGGHLFSNQLRGNSKAFYRTQFVSCLASSCQPVSLPRCSCWVAASDSILSDHHWRSVATQSVKSGSRSAAATSFSICRQRTRCGCSTAANVARWEQVLLTIATVCSELPLYLI